MKPEEANPDMYAICRDCGHKWKPRNPNAKNPKCSKCGSMEIAYESDGAPELSEDPTSEEIARLINQSTEQSEPEENHMETIETEMELNEPTAKMKKIGFKLHPTLVFIGIALLLGAGAAFFFRRRSKKQILTTPAQEERYEEEPTRAARPTIGHYRNEA